MNGQIGHRVHAGANECVNENRPFKPLRRIGLAEVGKILIYA